MASCGRRPAVTLPGWPGIVPVFLMFMVLLWSQHRAMAFRQRLCGTNLANALSLVCSDRGFYTRSTHHHKRSRIGALPDSGLRFSGVVDECCKRTCSYQVLNSYCAFGNPSENRPVFDLLGLQTGPTTTTTTAAPALPTDASLADGESAAGGRPEIGLPQGYPLPRPTGGSGFGNPIPAYLRDRPFFFVTPARPLKRNLKDILLSAHTKSRAARY